MRLDLRGALGTAWECVGRAGTWWSGAERVKIARESRAARTCGLCRERKTALAPLGVTGAHRVETDLSPAAIEAIHRIVTDPGRLSDAWYRRVLGMGLDDAAYIELLGVVAITTAVDTFDRASGAALRPLPAIVPGTPSRRRPAGAKPGLGWMPMLAPEDVTADDPPLYASAGRIGGNVHRALSLVPQAMMQFWDMFETMYLPQDAMRDFGREYRAITHPQIEMLAARVAVRNQCVY
jgi:alkylhydroperoxidase family enzyme